ncbi:MAG: aminomethyltransferase family protein, partial [Geminicoccales bacterium]
LMLREDGIVLDDGTVSRLSDNLWYVTTTTAHAARILAHMEFHRQAVWPDLAVELTDVTEQLAGIALAGPGSRAVLARAVGAADVSDAALPFMGAKEARIAGCPVLLLRISFSGERAYEIHTPSGYGSRVWGVLMAAGENEGIVPYGTEAMGMLRLEKGHAAGAELDGRTTPADLGLERLASRKKDYVGRAAQGRPALLDPKRLRLVGLVPEDGRSPIRPGAQIVEDPVSSAPVPSLGHVTSADFSPMLEKPIALALVSGGLKRKGQTLHATYPLKGETVAVVVSDPVFFDPEGRRLRG